MKQLARKAINWVEQVFNLEDRQMLYFGRATHTGKTVTERSALQTIAVFRCVELISTAGASFPIDVTKRKGSARESQQNHPVEYLLDSTPNPDMSSMDFRVVMWASVLLWGNAYAFIVRRDDRDPESTPIALYPLQPDYVTIERSKDTGDLIYRYRFPAKADMIYLKHEILHIRGFSLDGIHGLSRIQCMKEGIGLHQATEEYAARFFRHGASNRLALEVPMDLSDTKIDQIRKAWEEQYSGVENSHKLALLTNGMTLKTLSINPADSQLLEQRQTNDEQIASGFGVPPHMIGITSKVTSWGAGIGEQKQGFLDFKLGPDCVSHEKSYERCLLSSRERDLSIKHNTSAFLRMDPKARMETHGIAVEKGIYNRNEVRAFEDQNPYDGGDVYTVQSQLVPINMLEEFHRANKTPGGTPE